MDVWHVYCCLFINICITFYDVIATLLDLEMDRRIYEKLPEDGPRMIATVRIEKTSK